jgi:hypothetical protein
MMGLSAAREAGAKVHATSASSAMQNFIVRALTLARERWRRESEIRIFVM